MLTFVTFAAEVSAGTVLRGPLYVPNASFELPAVGFADPRVDLWQKAPEPAWYQGGETFPWEQLTGVFLNTPPGTSNHIDNVDGGQAAFLFALPGVALFQESARPGGTSQESSAIYEAGKSYALTAALLGGGGGMTNGATLELSLFYRDVVSNVVKVAALTVTNSADLFPTNSHLVDFQVRTPVVRVADAWFGKPIGIRVESTAGFDLQGGYWDIDNVRLTESALPNNSFESPATDFADPRMEAWQKSPEPAWYQGGATFPWDQLMGQFRNTPAGATNHIDNMDGAQGAFVFALPGVALFQDRNSQPGTNNPADPGFDLKFQPGKSYALTVALAGGGGGMSNAATFQISLYYRDASSNVVTVAARTITNSNTLFPSTTHLVDFQVRTPVVQATDPWAGLNVGVRLESTVDFALQGGYWDVDNVRLTEDLVPNGSFESPATDFADPRMDAWLKAPQPAWYTGGGSFPWDQLAGQFLNTPPGASNHIDNIDGNQGAFLFALPDVAIAQEFASLAGTSETAKLDFTGKFEPGKSYALTVGVLGGGGGMSNGATLEVSLFYRDANSNAFPVTAATITNSGALFPTNSHLVEFRTATPTVSAGDPWSGKSIGIRIASTTGFDRQGGYWDLDNVRLEVIQAPIFSAPTVTNGVFHSTVQSQQGRFEILSSTNVAAPAISWTPVATITNLTGIATFADTNSIVGQRFYRVRPAP